MYVDYAWRALIDVLYALKTNGSTTKNSLRRSFLSYDNFSLNCVQPTSYIELGELAFPLQSKLFLQVPV